MEKLHTHFKSKLSQSFYVYGHFINGSRNKDEEKISVLSKNSQIKGIGGTNKNEPLWFGHEIYIKHFSELIFSLKDSSGKNYFTQEDIRIIIRSERLKDYDRGEKEAPYFRSLVFYWLEKTGTYIVDASYIGYCEQVGESLEKHCFWIHSFIRRGSSGRLVTINQFTDDTFLFDDFFYSQENSQISMMSIKKAVVSLYRGKHGGYLVLLQEFLRQYSKLYSKSIENKIFSDFLKTL